MRRIALGLVPLIAAAAFADDKKLGKWTAFTSQANGYQSRFPDKPKSEAKDLATAAGVVRTETDRAEAGRDLEVAVTVATYPDGFKDVGAKTVLDGVRDGLKGSDGRVTADAAVTISVGGTTVTGREFRVEAGRNAVRCRAFLVGNRLYQVMATGSREAVGGLTAELFFGSFELLP